MKQIPVATDLSTRSDRALRHRTFQDVFAGTLAEESLHIPDRDVLAVLPRRSP